MTEITNITLENEMDLIVAHKRTTSVGEYLGLTIATRTTLATAVAEVSREIIDKTDTGVLTICVNYDDGKYFLCGSISYTGNLPLDEQEEGMSYAKKLVPEFLFRKGEKGGSILLQIGIPRFIKVNHTILHKMQLHFQDMKPATPYEELKARNTQLYKLTIEKDAQLKYSQYLDEKKNEFISTASHELKTPLSTILAFSQILLSMTEEECSPKVRAFVEKIYAQSGKLQLLIHQLLDVSKMEAGHLEYNKEELNFPGYINEVINTLRLVHPQHTIVVDDREAARVVHADKMRLEQVLTNLIGNAAKYSSIGSTIYVQISRDKENMNMITVRDEGIGINATNLDAIFKKFYREEQVSNKIGGLGIGLYITKNIVEEHGGTIWAESKEGKGSSFKFTIPALH